jgi:glycosyltransferase involved in cell wall biosynthesis
MERLHFGALAAPESVRYVPNPVPGHTDIVADGTVRAVAFVGWYGHAPNEAAAIELITAVMPAIRTAGGPRQLKIIGRDPTPAMRRAAANDADTEITGDVPDPVALLADAGLLVTPIRSGGGTRIKVLEAASIGVPVVSTRIGVEGLDFAPGRHYLLAETAAEFGAQVVRLTNDRELRVGLVSEAKAIVTERFSPTAVLAAVRASLPTATASFEGAGAR